MSRKRNSSAQLTTLGLGRTMAEIFGVSVLCIIAFNIFISLLELIFFGEYKPGSPEILQSPLLPFVKYVTWFAEYLMFPIGAYIYGLKRKYLFNQIFVFSGWLLISGIECAFALILKAHAPKLHIYSPSIIVLVTILQAAINTVTTFYGCYRRQKRQSRRT